MANQPETPVYDSGVYQVEVADPVQGGVGGVSNAPLLNLARRTAYLKQHMDSLETAAVTFATLNSPALTGTPTTPTPPLGDSTQKIPSTDWVQKSIGGILNKSVAGASNVSLTTVEAGNGIFLFTGVITANIAVIVPTVSKYWVVANRTTGNFSLTVKTAAGTGVVIPQGLAVVVYCDGTNVFLASSAGQASFTPYLFSPAAGTTSLTITNGYTPGCVMVEKNGAMLRTSDYTATNGTTIVIPATVASDQFTVYAFSSFSIANVVQKSGDVMAGALALFAGSTAPTPAAGTRTTALATMANFANEFVSSLTSNGYQKFPSGLILQWQTVTIAAAPAGSSPGAPSILNFTFPIPFITACFGCVASAKGSTLSTHSDAFVSAEPTSISGGTAQNNYNNSSISVFIVSIGI